MDISNFEVKSLRQLVKPGVVDINTRLLWKNNGDISVLQLAIDYGDDEFIDDLLLNQVDVNLNTESYGTAVHQAVSRGDLGLVKKLVNHGADINIKSCSGDKFTALHAAVKSNQYQIAEFLIKSEADLAARIDIGGFYKWTPLDLAIFLNKIDFVELLLKYVNFYRNLDFCHSPVYLAIRVNKIPIVKLFLDRGAKVTFLNRGTFGSCLSLTFETDNLEIFKLFLNDNENLVTTTDGDDNSLIHLAVRESSRDILGFLLKNGADINVVNKHNQTALDLALVKFSENQHGDNSRNLEIIETILEHIVELCAANMYLIKKNLQAISSEEFDCYYDDCSSDVKNMKDTKIGEK
ncbi:putative ankyrin repeat protein RF_0580 [Microplitis mediator]|uniref:putative ankyrin repeat protein RF_0580 n=1 Tax=Microplitis mediator TaxID=375433 RepID=UPI002554E0B2|nr:putative ankyrin repeat protein RF_0580 [Microplitis mediator]